MLELMIMRFGNDYNVRIVSCDWKKVDDRALNNTWVMFKDGMTKTSEDTIGGPSESYLGINYLKGGKERFSIPFETGGAITSGGDDNIEDHDKEEDDKW